MTTRYVGIDPGMNGGIAVFADSIADPLYTTAMIKAGKDINLREIAGFIHACTGGDPTYCFLEQPNLVPGWGLTQAGKLMRNVGRMEGILAALKLPYTLVSPQRWQKTMHVGVSDPNPKLRSALAASRLYATSFLRASAKSKRLHDGIVDACLIGDYGRRIQSSSEQAAAEMKRVWT